MRRIYRLNYKTPEARLPAFFGSFMKKRCFLALALLLALLLTGCASGDNAAQEAYEALNEYYAGQPVASNEYLRALAWAKSGAGYEGWQADCHAAAEEILRVCDGVLSNTKSTEYSAGILTLSAAGYDARDIGGYDLTAALFDIDFVTKQGINGAIFALLALDCGDYPAPEGVREALVEDILSRQLSDGGFAFSGERADPDITAMALCALAGYRDQPEIAEAVERAVETLSLLQNENGGFSSYGEENAESCAQVVLALAALDIATDDECFVKNGASALDALLSYQLSDGGFAHEAGGDFDAMATYQAYAALTAAQLGVNLYAKGNER